MAKWLLPAWSDDGSCWFRPGVPKQLQEQISEDMPRELQEQIPRDMPKDLQEQRATAMPKDLQERMPQSFAAA